MKVNDDDWGEPLAQGTLAGRNRKSRSNTVRTLFLIFNLLFFSAGLMAGKLLWIGLNGLAAFLLFMLIVFLPGNAFALYQHGFELPRSLFQDKIKKRPLFVPVKDILYIDPQYSRNGFQSLGITNFRFHYSETEFFTLPWRNGRVYLDMVQEAFAGPWAHLGSWDSLFREDYELERLDWDRMTETFLRRRKTMIKGALIGSLLSGTILAALVVSLGFSALTSQPFESILVLVMSFNLGMKWSIMKVKKVEEELLVLLKFIQVNKLDSVPVSVLELPGFRKWAERSSVEFIETYAEWLSPETAKLQQQQVRDLDKAPEQIRALKRRMGFVAVFLSIMLGVLAVVIFLPVGSVDQDASPGVLPSQCSFNHTSSVVIQGETITLEESFIVGANGSVTLENVTLIFSATSSKEVGFYVAEGGELVARNTTFKPQSSSCHFHLEVYGSASFHNCQFFEFWGEKDETWGKGGVEIYNDDVLLDGCLIADARVSGIVIGHCSPTIVNNIIRNCNDDGIEVYGGSALIQNNTLSDNGDGIMTYKGATPRIEANQISGSVKAIGVIEDADPQMTGNEFNDNEEDVFRAGDYQLVQCMLYLPIAMLLFFIPFIGVQYRKQKKQILQEYGLQE